MTDWTRRGFITSLTGLAATTALGAQQKNVPIKITDLRCAIIGRSPVVRIVTDQGISGYGEAESYKPYLKPMVLFYRDYLLGEDPTDVQRVMLKIRRLGAFKPWGAAVSAIEIALWDLAGQVAGVPVYKLLGGKIRDRVRIYNGGVRFPMTGHTPQDYAETMAKMKEAKEGFTLIKQAVGFHDPAMMPAVPNAWYDEPARKGASHPDRGMMTGTRPRQRDRLRRGDEEGTRQRGWFGPRLRTRLDGQGCDHLCPRHGTAAHRPGSKI